MMTKVYNPTDKSYWLYSASTAALTPTPTTLPTEDTTAVPVAPNPAAPTDCNVATIPPATVGAHIDIIEAAIDPPAIPPAVKPIPDTTIGAAATKAAPPTITPLP